MQVTNGVKLLSMASVTEAKGNALISWEVPATMTTTLFVVVMARLMPTSARQIMQVSTLITQAPVIMIGPAKSARIISAQVASGAELSVPAMTSVQAKGVGTQHSCEDTLSVCHKLNLTSYSKSAFSRQDGEPWLPLL